jgi:polyphosphate kinase 2
MKDKHDKTKAKGDKKKKKKGKLKAAEAMAPGLNGGNDKYQPSPILDDFSEFSEGRQPKLDRKLYEKELARLQVELVKMQYWIKHVGYRLILLFEGRDAAGKGGTIKRITEPLNPRGCQVVALGTPSDQQKSQWYFQRYVEHFPSAGQIVLFDRSWYNRAGVERVMGFCTPEQVDEFMLSCPEFERMLVRSGITLIKYWFSVSDEEQEARFRSRLEDPARWIWNRAIAGWSSPVPRTRCSPAPTFPRLPGSPWRPTTSGGPGSTASATCSARCPTRT